MPRYFFHVHDGQYLPDREGTDLPDLTGARLNAVLYTGELLSRDTEGFWNGELWHMDVTDEVGVILFTLDIVATDPTVVQLEGSPGHEPDG
ncbi:DUF6894 family protein [Roseomonas populi]|uniref:DUF6894 family protein n=1 Tax=Roseomonas populi TaxID=3121582 RepID=UPI0038CD6571